MQRTKFWLVSFIPFLSLAGVVAAQETVENPEYKKWAAWKEGAYATLKGENKFGDVVTITTSTQTFKTVAADKVVIEITTVVETNGKTIKAPPTTMEILARMPKLPEELRKMVEEEAKRLEAKQTKGKETLTIKGKKLACEWFRYDNQGVVSKSWTCAEVPNQIVRMESTFGPTVTTMLLIDWKGEKK